MYLKEKILMHLSQALATLETQGLLPPGAGILPDAERPASPGHGEYATNLAMKMAKAARKSPRDLAEALAQALRSQSGFFERVDVAGPGFVNLHLHPGFVAEEVRSIRQLDRAFGESRRDGSRKLLLEFVSANPVGPLNVVSARAAAIGDSLARILAGQGVEVRREYYVNDAGRQARLLGESLLARWRQARGEDASLPEDGYQGEYVADLARECAEARPEISRTADPAAAAEIFRQEGVARMVASHRRDLESLGVRFDTWYSELELHRTGKVEAVVETLRRAGYLFEQEGALWFRSTEFGDDKDRVLKKANGDWAYIAADIAYHQDKFDRGFGELLDLWGPDHHGYIARMQAALRALGHPAGSFQVHIVQQVNLLEQGKPVAMSKRAGRFITMAELLADVGPDVARFFFLMRGTDSHLDFDLDLARKHTEDNPVFYIQYAHARICSILKKAEAEGFSLPWAAEGTEAAKPPSGEERGLARELAAYPETLRLAAQTLEPHGVAFALRDAATAFHRFYSVCRVLDPSEPGLSRSRLALIDAARIVLRNGLELLGLTAPESM